MTNVRTLPVGEGNEEITLALDELAREGARRMIAAALRAEAMSTSSGSATRSTRTGIGWWSVTVARGSGR
jgi:hypothetical protein